MSLFSEWWNSILFYLKWNEMHLSEITWHKDVNFINIPNSLLYDNNGKHISIHFTYLRKHWKFWYLFGIYYTIQLCILWGFRKNEIFDKS